MSQILHEIYSYKKIICHLSEIQIQLGVLYFYLLNLATLPFKANFNALPNIKMLVVLAQ